MRRCHLFTDFIETAGQRRFDNHSLDALFGFEGEIRFTQTFIPGDGNAGFTREGTRIITGFARFFEEGNASTVLRINVFRELLSFQRRPGPVGVKSQMQLRDRLK